MPRMFIISGPNGSGKTTASYTLLPDMLECREFVNSDEFAKSLSPFDPGAASVDASRKMILKINYLIARKLDFCVETTLATRSLMGIIRQAREAGYYITLIYFWISNPEIAIERVHNRVLAGGHNIDEDTIRRRYMTGLRYFFEFYSPVCDRWVLADNTTTPFAVVAEGNPGQIRIRKKERYKEIKDILNDTE